MLVMFKGTGCEHCPFYKHRHLPQVHVNGKPMIPEVWCALNGMAEDGGKLEIKLDGDGVRKGDCPFHGIGTGQIEVVCYE